MDIEKFLERATALPGEPGYEAGVGGYLAEQFAPLADEVSVDPLQNVIARVGKGGPRVLICAHQDEIGLVVTRIEEDGCLRVTRNGGVDPRILPGMEVAVQAKSGPIYGVIGAKPPHLLTEKDREKALKITDLYVDIGYPAEKARELVRVGDMVVMLAKPIQLADGAMASKTARAWRPCWWRRKFLKIAAQRPRLCLFRPHRRKWVPKARWWRPRRSGRTRRS